MSVTARRGIRPAAAAVAAALLIAGCGDGSPAAKQANASSNSSTTTQGSTAAQQAKSASGSSSVSTASSSATAGKESLHTRVIVALIACMRAHAIKIQPPNLSGHGPLYTLKGVNTHSRQFQTARSRCLTQIARQIHR
jgi:ABC-type phosphate transport system substrate-binding protein